MNFCLSLCTDLNACYVYKTLPRLAVRHSRSAKNPGICWSWSCSSTRLFLFFSQCAESITTSLSTSWNKQVLGVTCKFTYLFVSTLTNFFFWNSCFCKYQVSTKILLQLIYFSGRYSTCLRKSSKVWNIYTKMHWLKQDKKFFFFLINILINREHILWNFINSKQHTSETVTSELHQYAVITLQCCILRLT